MKLYPIMINLEDKLVAVIGGGEVAMRKVSDLLSAGASVKVVSPEINEGIIHLLEENPNRLEIVKRKYEHGDIENATLVFSATDSMEVNRHVFEESKERNLFINAADDPPNCSFYIPSFIRKGDLIMALTTSGTSPSMAARLRRELEKLIPDNIERVLKSLNIARNMLKGDSAFSHLDFNSRGGLLKSIVNSDELLEKISNIKEDDEMRKFLNSI